MASNDLREACSWYLSRLVGLMEGKVTWIGAWIAIPHLFLFYYYYNYYEKNISFFLVFIL